MELYKHYFYVIVPAGLW